MLCCILVPCVWCVIGDRAAHADYDVQSVFPFMLKYHSVARTLNQMKFWGRGLFCFSWIYMNSQAALLTSSDG